MSEQPEETKSEGWLAHLRDVLLSALDRGENPWWRQVTQTDGSWLGDMRKRAWWNSAGDRERALWVSGQLSACRDILPDNYCELMNMPRGSTFADAVRKLENDAR